MSEGIDVKFISPAMFTSECPTRKRRYDVTKVGGAYRCKMDRCNHASTPRPPMATKITWLYTPTNFVNNMVTGDLELVPDNFTIASFNHAFSEENLSKGLIYYQEGYIHNVTIITINKNKDNTVIISARCFRSMRKGETPHQQLTVDLSDSAVTDAYCSCTAG